MKLNKKKVFIVVFIIILIIVGIWAGISITRDNYIESVEKETAVIGNLINNFETTDDSVNNVETSTNTSVTNNALDISIDSNTVNTNNIIDTNKTTTNSNNEEKNSLNSYLEKFSLICYLDSRTKSLDKEIKRNEDYIDIAMHIAEEYNILGEKVEGKQAISRQTINKIISEIRGRTTTDVLKTADVLYSYDNATDQYYFKHTDNRIAHILKIQENTTENGVVNVKYTCCFPNETQLANNNFSGLGKYVITMELKENTSYNYSKYRIQNYQFVIE